MVNYDCYGRIFLLMYDHSCRIFEISMQQAVFWDCEQDWIWSKKADPRGLSLGGDREDLGPTDVSPPILAL
jgi:hypothetical protein